MKWSILRRHRSHTSSLIRIGDIAAYNFKDANVDRFYIVKWDTKPSCVDGKTGKLVCDACFYDSPLASHLSTI